MTDGSQELTAVRAASTVPACELQVGDRVFVDGRAEEVLVEPLTMHRGLGLFDEFELLVEVRTRVPGGTGQQVRVLGPWDGVAVERPEESSRRADG